ncbi:metalloregulator ArsR/SmtB family transcription factor [Microcella daejeonensis]|uniref:Metalloregulator ArsR/SmtB family transcription factor n=1 Tax=Microcella daejeonensis TaxID=2994971 RepID=A0A9E8S7U1_9MICO|nr:metalloregulator ArsR/SmtB family transcription factor [Microcella daejeonensis]WAB80498.1 metalloregulator ArsR/SmtB family transcription factor [Microcella daejeonensis]
MTHAATLALLGSPIRWRIVEVLASGPATAGEIADEIGSSFRIARESASKHLQLLARAGLIECERDMTTRLYRLSPRLIGALQALVDRLVALREPAGYDDLGTEASAGLEPAPHPDELDGDGCWCIRKAQELAPVSTRASPMYTLGGW